MNALTPVAIPSTHLARFQQIRSRSRDSVLVELTLTQNALSLAWCDLDASTARERALMRQLAEARETNRELRAALAAMTQPARYRPSDHVVAPSVMTLNARLTA